MVRFVVCVALLGGASGAAAQPLTLGDALKLANAQHPLLRAADAGVDVAEAGIVTARAYPNPQASVIAGTQSTGAGTVRTGVPAYVFEQPLELGGLRSSRVGLAERGRESSGYARDEVRLSVLAGVRRTFYLVLRRRAEVETATENVRFVEALRDRIKVRVDVGEVGRLELVRAEAEVASARTLASSARLQQVTALAQFRAAVGGRLPVGVELSGALEPTVTLPAIEALRQQAIAQHPTLALAQSEVRRADARLAYETAQRRPQPTVRSEIDATDPTYRVGVGIPLPLWNRRQGPIAEAQAATRQAAATADARQIAILEALEGAVQRYEVANQQVVLFEQGLLREAEEALRAAEVAYQLGERGILEVLDAQRVLRAVRIEFVNAQYDRQAALVDLDELRGVDLRGMIP